MNETLKLESPTSSALLYIHSGEHIVLIEPLIDYDSSTFLITDKTSDRCPTFPVTPLPSHRAFQHLDPGASSSCSLKRIQGFLHSSGDFWPHLD